MQSAHYKALTKKIPMFSYHKTNELNKECAKAVDFFACVELFWPQSEAPLERLYNVRSICATKRKSCTFSWYEFTSTIIKQQKKEDEEDRNQKERNTNQRKHP